MIVRTVLILSILLLQALKAQDRVSLDQSKPRVAVLPFDMGKISESQVFDKSGAAAFAEAATQKVLNAFVQLKRFTVIERAVIDKVLKEQNFQAGDWTDPNSMTSLGNLLGTQYIIHGQIQNVTTAKKEKKFIASISLNLRIIDVASAEIKNAIDMKGKSSPKKEITSKIAYEALDDLENRFVEFIRKAFPVEGKVVKYLEDEGNKKKKNGKQKDLVLISCGKEMGVRVGDRFLMVKEEDISVDGKMYKRQKAVGKLVVKRLEVDGIFSVCEVLEGKKVLYEELDKENQIKVISSE